MPRSVSAKRSRTSMTSCFPYPRVGQSTAMLETGYCVPLACLQVQVTLFSTRIRGCPRRHQSLPQTCSLLYPSMAVPGKTLSKPVAQDFEGYAFKTNLMQMSHSGTRSIWMAHLLKKITALAPPRSGAAYTCKFRHTSRIAIFYNLFGEPAAGL